MSDKSQPPRRTPHGASSHPKRPYRALLIRAQSPEPIDDNSTDNEATSSQKLEMNQTKNKAAKKAPYKARLMRAKSPESSDEEDDDQREEPKKKRRMPRKKNAPLSISSEEPEVTQTDATQEPEV